MYVSDHDTVMMYKENQMSRKGVYYSQHTEHRASMLVTTKGWQESWVPSTGSGSSLLAEEGIYPLICNSETSWNRFLSFLLKTKQHRFFQNMFDGVAVLPGHSLVTTRTWDNRMHRFKTPSTKGHLNTYFPLSEECHSQLMITDSAFILVLL